MYYPAVVAGCALPFERAGAAILSPGTILNLPDRILVGATAQQLALRTDVNVALWVVCEVVRAQIAGLVLPVWEGHISANSLLLHWNYVLDGAVLGITC